MIQSDPDSSCGAIRSRILSSQSELHASWDQEVFLTCIHLGLRLDHALVDGWPPVRHSHRCFGTKAAENNGTQHRTEKADNMHHHF
jgi:hypothetical protein